MLNIEKDIILFVDDEKICHTFAQLIIHNFTKYQLVSALSGEEVLALAKKHAGKIALIISDIMLPDTNGYELYITLSKDKNFSKIPFIFQSGLSSQEKELKKRIDTEIPILYKPYKQEILLQAIKKAIID